MRTRTIAILSAVALGAGLLVAQGPGRRMGMGRGNQGEFAQNRLERLAQFLDLTDAQKAQAKQFFDVARQQMQALAPQLRENHQAIQNLVKNGGPQFDAELQKLASAQGSLISQMVVTRTKAEAQLLSILTPEQREKITKLRNLFGPGPMGRRMR